ncbi:MAG: hypothetical protein EHM75_08390 [Desulfobacteraceae bacterium]|nr:MAG: hypothetical protein EHM75_08390 [Desulfobacteraceae bacterium]
MAKDKDSDPRSIGYEILGLGLAALTLLLALSLFTHHPADLSFSATESGRQAVQNWTGRLGSYLSSFLFDNLGLASFWLVFILGHLTFFTFKRQARRASPSWYAWGIYC